MTPPTAASMPPPTPRRPLRTALEKAIDKFEAFQAGDRVTVTIAATQDGNAVTPAQATFTSEFGTVTTVKNAGSVQLVPATYQFDLSDGGINHVRGTVEVTAQGAAVSAPCPPASGSGAPPGH